MALVDPDYINNVDVCQVILRGLDNSRAADFILSTITEFIKSESIRKLIEKDTNITIVADEEYRDLAKTKIIESLSDSNIGEFLCRAISSWLKGEVVQGMAQRLAEALHENNQLKLKLEK